MKKTVAILLAILLLAFSAVACTDSEKPAPKETGGTEGQPVPTNTDAEGAPPVIEKDFTVGFSVITLTIEYYAEMKDAFIDICTEKGWEYIVTESGQDVEATVNDCMDLINMDIDALVIASWYGDSMGEVLENAKQKNIPVYFMNTGGLNEAESWVSHVIADDVKVGRFVGAFTAPTFLDKGQDAVNVIPMSTATSVGRDRVDGFIQGLQDAGLKVNILNEYLGSTREDYLGAMEDALTAYPQIDIVYGVSTVCQLGAYDAIAAAQRTDEIIVVGWDNSAEDMQIIDSGTNYLGTVAVDATYEMSICLEKVEAYANGNEIERVSNYYPPIYTANGFVTADDILD